MFPRFFIELPRACGSGRLGLDTWWEQMFFQNFQYVLFQIKPGIAQEKSFVVAGTSWPRPQPQCRHAEADAAVKHAEESKLEFSGPWKKALNHVPAFVLVLPAILHPGFSNWSSSWGVFFKEKLITSDRSGSGGLCCLGPRCWCIFSDWAYPSVMCWTHPFVPNYLHALEKYCCRFCCSSSALPQFWLPPVLFCTKRCSSFPSIFSFTSRVSSM